MTGNTDTEFQTENVALNNVQTVVFSTQQVLRRSIYVRQSAQYTAERRLGRYKPKLRGNKERKL